MAGRAMRPVRGKKIPGMMPPRLPSKTKVNSVARYGTNRSPSRPMTSRAIWLRMKSTSPSITFWSPEGTSLGLRKAKKNSAQTTSPTRNIWSTTRLMLRSTPPTWRSTMLGHSNSSMVGAWKPSRARGSVAAVIVVAPSAAAVALDDQVEGAGHADDDADGHQVPGAEPAVEEPADAAPGAHAGDQRADDRPDDVGAAAGGLPGGFGFAHGRANLSSRPRRLLGRLLVGDDVGDLGPHGEADLGRQVDHGPGDQGEGEGSLVEGGRVPEQEQQQADDGHLEGEGDHRRRQHQLGLDPAGRPHRQQGGREEGDGQGEPEGRPEQALGAGQVPGQAERDRRGGRGGQGGPAGHAYLLGHRAPAFRSHLVPRRAYPPLVAAPSPAWKWTVNLPATTVLAPSGGAASALRPRCRHRRGETTPPRPRPGRAADRHRPLRRRPGPGGRGRRGHRLHHHPGRRRPEGPAVVKDLKGTVVVRG